MKNPIEQVIPAETPGEMRVEIIRMQHHDALVSSVFDRARYSGMTTEDMYTMLAYHALRSLKESNARELELLRLTSTPLFTIKIPAIKQEDA